MEKPNAGHAGKNSAKTNITKPQFMKVEFTAKKDRSMKKYIDAEKLVAEIDGMLSACTKQTHTGVYNTCHRIKGIIASLQQEQPPVNLVAELKHHLATTPKEQLEKEWKELEPWGNIGPTVQEFLYGKQSEVDLQKEIESEWKKCLPIDEGMGVEVANIHIEAFDIIARHFYERGMLNAMKQ